MDRKIDRWIEILINRQKDEYLERLINIKNDYKQKERLIAKQIEK